MPRSAALSAGHQASNQPEVTPAGSTRSSTRSEVTSGRHTEAGQTRAHAGSQTAGRPRSEVRSAEDQTSASRNLRFGSPNFQVRLTGTSEFGQPKPQVRRTDDRKFGRPNFFAAAAVRVAYPKIGPKTLRIFLGENRENRPIFGPRDDRLRARPALAGSLREARGPRYPKGGTVTGSVISVPTVPTYVDAFGAKGERLPEATKKAFANAVAGVVPEKVDSEIRFLEYLAKIAGRDLAKFSPRELVAWQTLLYVPWQEGNNAVRKAEVAKADAEKKIARGKADLAKAEKDAEKIAKKIRENEATAKALRESAENLLALRAKFGALVDSEAPSGPESDESAEGDSA